MDDNALSGALGGDQPTEPAQEPATGASETTQPDSTPESGAEPTTGLDALRARFLDRLNRVVDAATDDAPDDLDRALAAMSPDQREVAQIEIDQFDAWRSDLETRTWLAERRAEDRELADVFGALAAEDDPDRQWQMLQQWRDTLLEAAQPDEPELTVPDVDPNNPGPMGRVPAGTPVSADGIPLTREFRRDFLKNLTHWPGAD
jgi:hypothetical protein